MFFVLNDNKPLCQPKRMADIKALLILNDINFLSNYAEIGNYTGLHKIHLLPIIHDDSLVQ